MDSRRCGYGYYVSTTLRAATLFSFLAALKGALGEVVPFVEQGFEFSYQSEGETAALPISSRCEKVAFKWNRGDATGKAPIAPYFLKVMSSSPPATFEIDAGNGPTFEWEVPFAPHTQYQVCMWDRYGASGGCQAVYTVVPAQSTNMTCNSPPETDSLDVAISPLTGPGVSPRVPLAVQCSDISVTPKTGAPPFTLTVSPSLHPPVTIESKNMNPITWTVALPEGHPFFLSMSSSDNLTWTHGPMYAKNSGDSNCLSPSSVSKNALTAYTVGGSLGGLVLGAILGAVCTFFFYRRKSKGLGSKMHIGAPSSSAAFSKPEEVPPSPTRSAHSNLPPRSRTSSTTRRPSPGPPPPPIPTNITTTSYPPPRSLPNTPSQTPDWSQMSFGSGVSRANTNTTGTIDPFRIVEEGSEFGAASSDTSSSQFPMDNKRRLEQIERQRSLQALGHARAPSLTTQASSSRFTDASSSNNSDAPLLGGGSSFSSSASASRRASRASRLTRAPTYTRHQPRTPMSVAELITDDRSLIGGHIVHDLPPQYMQTPADEEISVAGGRDI